MASVTWPEGKRFAFTVFDDPDRQTLQTSREVYACLDDLGFRTTKAVWVMEPRERNSAGDSCESPEFLEHVLALQARGFEIGYHNGAPGTLTRGEIVRSLELFRQYFGHDPVSMANHYNEDAVYWGNARLSGPARLFYNIARGGKRRFFGTVEGHPCFWGDLCRQHVRYCRNFVYRTINTLKACPYMPYIDPKRPYVAGWFASSEGANCNSYLRQTAERHQDQLEEEGGACIMYTHFGKHFVDGVDGRLKPVFIRLMERLASKDGWFVPVGTLLDHLRDQQGMHVLQSAERNHLEWRWLKAKLLYGTS